MIECESVVIFPILPNRQDGESILQCRIGVKKGWNLLKPEGKFAKMKEGQWVDRTVGG